MAGLALMVDRQNPPQSNVFEHFLESAANYKSLPAPDSWVNEPTCIAAKLNAPCSLHRDIVLDSATGSWLLAAGTVIDPVDVGPGGGLEKILTDYLEHGEKVFSRLDGQFAMILYDACVEKILVVSDPFGMIPIYYGQTGSQLLLSTSGLAIANLTQSPLNEFGARSFLAYDSTFGDTIWRDVHMLPPATVLEVGREGTRQSTYWSFKIDPQVAALGLNESVDCMVEVLSSSLRRSLRGEEKVWVSLTGGMDSRVLAALAHYSEIPFKTYCHGPLDSQDVRIAAQISQKMGWEHEYFPLPEDWGVQRVSWLGRVTGQTDGQLDVIKMSRTIREQTIKARQLGISLWGYGGELYRGIYWKHELWRTGVTSQVDYERLMDYRVIPADCSFLAEGERWKETLRAEVKNRLQTIGEQQPEWLNTVKLDWIGTALERHACGTTIAAVLGQQRVILPFYFKENIAHIFSINYKWRTHDRMFRLILERINPPLAQIETADRSPALPMRFSNFYRFVPYWLDNGEKLLWRLGYKFLGKPLWGRRNAGPGGRAYPTEQWLQDTLNGLSMKGLVAHDQMLSAYLYDRTWLRDLASHARAASLGGESMLGHIMALEMALQSIRNEK